MKHIIISISDSDKHFDTAIAEYKKRMWKSLEIINIKPIKYGEREIIITKETDLLIDKIKKIKKKLPESSVFLLTKWWKQWSTESLNTYINISQTYIFIIWWPYGMDEEKLASYVQKSMSFGLQTMPHGLAKLVLLEQLYRVSMIDKGRQYHY